MVMFEQNKKSAVNYMLFHYVQRLILDYYYYPNALGRVQITRKSSKNILRYWKVGYFV